MTALPLAEVRVAIQDRASGMGWGEIAAGYSHFNASDLQAICAASYPDAFQAAELSAARLTALRRCLRCARVFESRNPRRNRVCDTCKKCDEWHDGISEVTVGGIVVT